MSNRHAKLTWPHLRLATTRSKPKPNPYRDRDNHTRLYDAPARSRGTGKCTTDEDHKRHRVIPRLHFVTRLHLQNLAMCCLSIRGCEPLVVALDIHRISIRAEDVECVSRESEILVFRVLRLSIIALNASGRGGTQATKCSDDSTLKA